MVTGKNYEFFRSHKRKVEIVYSSICSRIKPWNCQSVVGKYHEICWLAVWRYHKILLKKGVLKQTNSKYVSWTSHKNVLFENSVPFFIQFPPDSPVVLESTLHIQLNLFTIKLLVSGTWTKKREVFASPPPLPFFRLSISSNPFFLMEAAGSLDDWLLISYC